MPSRESEPQPSPSLLPVPAPRSASAGPEPVSSGPQPTDSGQQPRPQAQPFLIPDPGAVVIAAPKPAMPIAKGLPGSGLLAHLIVSKYTDHMPLHRLQRAYERQGYFLHRSTLCDWLGACADLLRPLYDLMVSVVLQSRAIHTDDTPVKLQELVTHHLSTARLWVYLGDAAHPYNVFDFTVNHKRDGPQQFLANYRGYLQADAFSDYDGLYLPDPRTAAAARITEVPATPTRAASSTRRAAATPCARTRRWPITASSTNWSGLPRTSATNSAYKCARTWRCRFWGSSTHG